jgi:hypothetical protein
MPSSTPRDTRQYRSPADKLKRASDYLRNELNLSSAERIKLLFSQTDNSLGHDPADCWLLHPEKESADQLELSKGIRRQFKWSETLDQNYGIHSNIIYNDMVMHSTASLGLIGSSQ